MLFRHFRDAEAACRKYLADGEPKPGSNDNRHLMALPAYDQCIKASHIFNLLDARGVISVTERQSYILRVRELAKACGAAWLKTEGGGVAAVMPLHPDPRFTSTHDIQSSSACPIFSSNSFPKKFPPACSAVRRRI